MTEKIRRAKEANEEEWPGSSLHATRAEKLQKVAGAGQRHRPCLGRIASLSMYPQKTATPQQQTCNRTCPMEEAALFFFLPWHEVALRSPADGQWRSKAAPPA